MKKQINASIKVLTAILLLF